jgi:hypothetical protein
MMVVQHVRVVPMVRLGVENVIPTVVHLSSFIKVMIYVVGGKIRVETVTMNVGDVVGVKHTCAQGDYVECTITVVIVGPHQGVGLVLKYEILTIMHHK